MNDRAHALHAPADAMEAAVAAQSAAARGGKVVEVFAVEGDVDTTSIRSNHFEPEWPPRSGRIEHFPEVAHARWMTLADARAMMLPSQVPLLDALERELKG